MRGLLMGFADSDASAVIALGGVSDPQRFGIAEVRDGRVLSVEEKPPEPKSNLAICGVYLFRSSIFEAIRTIKPSWRDELEITDAIQALIDSGEAVDCLRDQWLVDRRRQAGCHHSGQPACAR